MEKKEVAKLLGQIDLYYPGKIKDENKKAMLEGWTELLKPCRTEKVNENLMEHVRKSPFPPTISDLGKNAGIVPRPKEYVHDFSAGED